MSIVTPTTMTIMDVDLRKYDLDLSKIDRTPISKNTMIRTLRMKLKSTDFGVVRHNEQILAEIETSLTDEEFKRLAANRELIRVKIRELRGNS